ncbi:hypothetical protein [Brevundimonas sp.]|uniref:hypothetical protein n=1 Tax=Brevundimonas sp. TaxID=1871086 RepID=UPI002D76D659|nr:hypothetical protein [Brevundimonas sp.]
MLLAVGLFGIFGMAGSVAIARSFSNPAVSNALIGCCIVGLLVWCLAAAAGHWARQHALDQHEATVRMSPDNQA